MSIIGSLMIRHKENTDRLQQLQAQYKTITQQVRTLDRILGHQQETIKVTSDAISSDYDRVEVPITLMSDLTKVLRHMQETNIERNSLETCLTHLGFKEYLPSV